MKQSIVHVALVVRDYDDAIRFYTEKLNFTVVEDTYQASQDKRWVVIAPPGSDGPTLLLARASTAEQDRVVGHQTGGRVFLFLGTDDFWRDFDTMTSRGITFVRSPKVESYGTVAVFEDLYGNRWDLVERTAVAAPASSTTLILWQRLDLPGHEFAELAVHDTGSELTGTALVVHEGRPCQLDYRIECDAAWRTRAVRIRGHVGIDVISLDLVRSAEGDWRANGAPVPGVAGCIDVDLGFSPSTNLLPIRRLNLSLGERAEVRAAWVRFPQLTLEVLEQAYTRVDATHYSYESAGGAFRRELEVNDDGLVLEYPGLFHAVAVTQSGHA